MYSRKQMRQYLAYYLKVGKQTYVDYVAYVST